MGLYSSSRKFRFHLGFGTATCMDERSGMVWMETSPR